jgi:nitrogen-specific signal transduction histidine kinase/DNA-binding response OmpR family regulator
MLSKAILLLLLAFINFMVAGFVFVNKKHLVNKLFAIFVCSFVGWIFSVFAIWVTFGKAINLFCGRVIYVPSSLTALSFLWFAEVFPDRKTIVLKKVLVFFTFLGLAIALLSFSPALVTRLQHVGAGQYRPIYGPAYPLFGFYFLFCFGYGLFILGRKWKKSHGLSKLQIQYLFLGMFLLTFGVTSTNLIIPVLFHTSHFSFYGPYFTLFFVGFTAHAIIRYRLMNIKAVISKSMVYFLSSVIALVILLGLFLSIRRVMSTDMNIPKEALIIATGLGGIIVFFPIKRLCQFLLDKYFYRETINLQRVMRGASRVLTSVLEQNELLDYLGRLIVEQMKVESVFTFLREKKEDSFRLKLEKSYFDTEYALFTVNSFSETLEFLNTTPVDVVIVDSEGVFYQAVRLTKDIKKLSPTSLVICLLSAEESEKADEDIAVFDFVLQLPMVSAELRTTVQKALEAHDLAQEVTLLRKQLALLKGNAIPSRQPEPAPLPLERILSQFARALSTSFDLDKMLNTFLDTVSELVRPSRISLFLYDENSHFYQMKAYRGFSVQFAKDFKLRPDEGLPKWLITEGRVICKGEAEEKMYEPMYLSIRNDMEALKSVVSVPLCAHGSLIGILNLSNQVTGIPYTNVELEILFILASHVAVAVQDISNHHKLQEQKNYIENILKGMSSGVITINKGEQVTICNQRASMILQKETAELLNKDLRCLPSPLGDMLFETMNTQRTCEKTEVTIRSPVGVGVSASPLPLEVTTYPILSRDGNPVGSVMVFDDISSRKQLTEQKRKNEQLELVNQIVGRMAHSIKNPLVSIQTFLQLYEERLDDPSFFEEFGSVAKRDLEGLNRLLEQTIALIEPQHYQFELIDINVLLNECVALLREEYADKPLEIVTGLTEAIPPVKCDREVMKRALWYLMKYLTNTMEFALDPEPFAELKGKLREGEGISTLSIASFVLTNVIRITMTGKGSKVKKEELDKLFDPIAIVQDADIDMGPCASQKIIEEHGGHIEVKSEPSPGPSKEGRAGGIRFVIDIPKSET